MSALQYSGVSSTGRKKQRKKVPPYPSERGTVEKVKRTDLAILLIVLFGSTAVGCGL